jgi:hypothetical protein
MLLCVVPEQIGADTVMRNSGHLLWIVQSACLWFLLCLVPLSESDSQLRMQHKSQELSIPGLFFVTGHGFWLFAASHGSQVIPHQLGIYTCIVI